MKRYIKSALFVCGLLLSVPLGACSFGADISSSQADTASETTTTSSSVTSQTTTTAQSKTTTSESKTTTAKKTTAKTGTNKTSLLTSADDIALTETGEGSYTFTYDGETYNAYYTPDNWKIVDSYKITDKADMIVICKALSDIYPIHTSDYTGYRTPEDLAYEWEQHNTAYSMLPDSSKWKANTKDVDLDPKDQGKSFLDMARDRLG